MTYQPGTIKDDPTTLAKLPGWVTVRSGETSQNVAFLSGASLAALDVMLTQAGEAIPHLLLRNTLALKAASATSKLEGRMSREADIRDAYHLTPMDGQGDRHWGPDGDVLAFWRDVVRVRLKQDDWIDQIARCCHDHEQIADWLDAAQMASMKVGPVAAAIQVMRSVLQVDDRAERIACCMADGVIARSLSWECLLPLTSLHLSKTDLRRLRDGAGETDVEMAIVRSTQLAFRMARALAKRKAALLSVAPTLRSRGSDDAVALFLSEDTVSPSGMLSPIIQGSRTEMSPRNARRLCDRLVELGVVRELTGRPTFRLYGVAP